MAQVTGTERPSAGVPAETPPTEDQNSAPSQSLSLPSSVERRAYRRSPLEMSWNAARRSNLRAVALWGRSPRLRLYAGAPARGNFSTWEITRSP